MNKLLKLCAGVDISMDDFHVRLLAIDGTTHQEKSLGKHKFANTPAGHKAFAEWLSKRNSGNAHLIVVMEATGVYFEELAHFLHSQGFKLSVQLPNKIKQFVRSFSENSKTDEIDAAGIARFGLSRKLRLWEPFSPLTRKLKLLSREYQRLEKTTTRTKNQMHASGKSVGGSSKTKARLAKLIALLSEQKKEIQAEMKALLAKDEELDRGVKILTSMFGVANKTALLILGETDGFKLFTSRSQLVKYCGYDVVSKQSGTSVRAKTYISKRGNSYIRKALHFPALQAMKKGIFKEVYERQYENTKCKMSALVAVQRKLLITMHALIKKNELYIEDYHKQVRNAHDSKRADQHEGWPAVAAS